MPQPSVTIFIPAYNEAESLSILLNQLAETLAKVHSKTEVILVNDGSTDGSTKVLLELAKRFPFLQVLEHEKNLGLTEAFNTALATATGQIFIFLPADLQSDPRQDVPKLLDKMANGNDVVVGQRQNRPFWSTLDSSLYNLFLHHLFQLPTSDINWIKAFRTEALKQLPLKNNWHRLLIPLAKKYGLKIATVPVISYPRQFGQSKYGWKRAPGAFKDIVAIFFLSRPKH